MTISPDQCRMARAGLKWTVADLATRADVRVMTVSRFERGGDAYASTIKKLQMAFEAAGIIFVSDSEVSLAGGQGIRLETPSR